MNEGCNSSITELPRIEFTKDVTEISRHVHIYLSVRGADLEECRKHFDEIKGGL